jgi:hypothetical protein
VSLETLEDQVSAKVSGLIDARRPYEANWQDIRELVRPGSSDFGVKTAPGQARTDNIYDGTAPGANDELASGLHSYLTNPVERWFSLGVAGWGEDDYDEDALAWLEYVSDLIYGQYNSEESGFNTAMHEIYLDIGAFGTGNVYQEYSGSKQNLTFKSIALGDSYLGEDKDGKIDTVCRQQEHTVRQLRQEYGELPENLSKKVKTESDKFVVAHTVFPRTDRDVTKLDARNKRFASIHMCVETREILKISGYDMQPFHTCRWSKLSNEVYGRGPAIGCLPDIRMLNVMERTLIKAGQKRADPPLLVPDEGYMLPIETAPGSLNFREPNAPDIIALEHRGDLQWGLEQAEQKREYIKKCFHADWLRMEKENKEMTAFEVDDRRKEKLSLLAPKLGRVQSEMLSPMVGRSYALLHGRGSFPPAPLSIQRKKLVVVYVSPAARAQYAGKAREMSAYVQEVLPFVQVYPAILDNIDLDKFAKKLAQYRGTPRTVFRDEQSVAAMRQQRAEQEQQQQMIAQAESASKSIANIAKAQSTTGI